MGSGRIGSLRRISDHAEETSLEYGLERGVQSSLTAGGIVRAPSAGAAGLKNEIKRTPQLNGNHAPASAVAMIKKFSPGVMRSDSET